ncbi:MAG: hypothetical protein CND85_03855 [Marine Group II euryarchaeote MED-G33]|nr:MAG: hypothetical protein CND85_03855 [Marine Group II euryarchaeote MED-G33]
MHQPGARDVATYNDDGMHHAGGPENPSATSPGFTGLRARAKSTTTHSRGAGLMDDAGEAIFTLGFSNLRFRAREAMKALFRSQTPRPRISGAPPSSTDA